MPARREGGRQGEDLRHSTGLHKTLGVPEYAKASSGNGRGFRAIFPSMPQVTVTRLLKFNAAHRVYNPALSDAENDRLFGKCNNPNWHGHNYTLEVSVTGEPDPKTGYVMDLGEVKRIATSVFVDRVDHKNFNLDVPFMKDIIPTTEHVVIACWRLLEPALKPARLTRLKLWETENHYVEYEGR